MIFHPMIGGGGASISVKAYASADELPITAKDGAIAVISATPVGTVFVQSAEPSVAKNGDLWISYGLTGSASVSSGNVTIYPSYAFQYLNSSWVKLPLFVWGNGKWNSPVTYLLNAEDEGVAVTGGWNLYGTVNSMASKIPEGLKVSAANTGYQKSGVQTKNAINVSDYSRIVFVGRVTAYYSYFGTLAGIQKNKASTVDEVTNNAAYVSINKSGEFSLSLDVSSYTGDYYVGITSGLEMIVTQIYME